MTLLKRWSNRSNDGAVARIACCSINILSLGLIVTWKTCSSLNLSSWIQARHATHVVGKARENAFSKESALYGKAESQLT